LRISRELSQENMAGELKLSTGAYSNIERGITDLTITRLYRIAEILDTNVFDLLDPNHKTEPVFQDPANKYGHEVERLRELLYEMKKDIDQLKKTNRKK